MCIFIVKRSRLHDSDCYNSYYSGLHLRIRLDTTFLRGNTQLSTHQSIQVSTMAPIPEVKAESAAYVEPAAHNSKGAESYMAALIAAGLFGVVAFALSLFATYHYIKIGVKKHRAKKRRARLAREEGERQRAEAESYRKRMAEALEGGASGEQSRAESVLEGGAANGASQAGSHHYYQQQQHPAQEGESSSGRITSDAAQDANGAAMERYPSLPWRVYDNCRPKPQHYRLERLAGISDAEEGLRVGEVRRGVGELVV